MKKEFKQAVEDPDSSVIDINSSGSSVLSILIQENETEAPKLIDGSIENTLLYIHNMGRFLDGDEGALLSRDPHVSIKPTDTESVYKITMGERTVENTPGEAGKVLQALRSAKEDRDLHPLQELYKKIIDKQVRRDVMNDILEVLPSLDTNRVEVTEDGWLVDGFYVLDWEAGVYVDNDTEETYMRGGGGVTTVDKSKEFVDLRQSQDNERKAIKLGGETILLGEQEMLFLKKARWLMQRTTYHPDESFWRYNENYRKKYLRGDI